MAYKKNRHGFWGAHIKDWENSGLSQTKYCKLHNLSLNSFSQWKLKLRQTDDDRSLVRIPFQLMSSTSIEITYKNDFRIACSGTEEMKQIIIALKELEC